MNELVELVGIALVVILVHGGTRPDSEKPHARPVSQNNPMQAMDETEARHRMKDVANAAALLRDAADNADGGPTVVHTPHGKAEIHADKHGADVKLPAGATVHVRW